MIRHKFRTFFIQVLKRTSILSVLVLNLTVPFSLPAKNVTGERCASYMRGLAGPIDRIRAWWPVRISSRALEKSYDLVFPRGQLRAMGEVKLYSLSPEARARRLIRYVRALDLADTEDIDERAYLEFRWIIKKRVHLGTQNFLDVRHAPNTFGDKPANEVELDDAVKLLIKNRQAFFELIRKDSELRTLNLRAEWVWRITKRPRNLIIGGVLLGSGMQIGTSLMNRWVLPAVAAAQKQSFRKSHETIYGSRSPLPEIPQNDERQMWEFTSRHNSVLDILQSSGRDDKIKIPQVVHTLGSALYQARNVQHDSILERSLLRDLFDVERWTRDFTGSEFGQNTRVEIEHLFDLYDPDGSFRREFDSAQNFK